VARGTDHVHVLASLRRTLAEPTAVVLAGCLGDAVMGHAVLTVTGTTATLAELWVEPGARGVGVGSCLLAAARSEATGRGCTGLDATALPGDRATKNFFEDHGMTARAIVVHGELGT
jgi:GNAT superfamily N-acetyltransferase